MQNLSKMLLIVVLVLSFTVSGYSHCQVPCGIYGDKVRIVMLKEHLTTIEKSMNQINELWNPNWTKVSFTMPDGFIVTIKPTSSKWVDFKLFGQLPITAKVGGVEKEKQALILYVSIIHAVDAYIAREVQQRCKFDLITIHDGYRILPNHAQTVKQYYNEVLALINDSNLFTDILSEILGVTVPPMEGDLNSEDILKAAYSLS